jgi:hypothetical protein
VIDVADNPIAHQADFIGALTRASSIELKRLASSTSIYPHAGSSALLTTKLDGNAAEPAEA